MKKIRVVNIRTGRIKVMEQRYADVLLKMKTHKLAEDKEVSMDELNAAADAGEDTDTAEHNESEKEPTQKSKKKRGRPKASEIEIGEDGQTYKNRMMVSE